MSLQDARNAIITGISKHVPPIAGRIEAHAGRLTPEDLAAISARAPIALAACLGVNNIRPGSGVTKADAVWGIFIVTGDKPGMTKDAAALAIVSAIIPLVPENTWGMDDVCDNPKTIRADNLYSGKLDRSRGVCIWAVTWVQEMDFGTLDAGSIDDLVTVFASWDLAPKDGVIDAENDITDLNQ